MVYTKQKAMRIILVSGILFLTCIHTALASYTVAPKVLDVAVEAREMIGETIRVTNTGTNVLRLYPTVNEVSVGIGGNIEEFVEPSKVDGRNTPTSWIKLSRARVEIPPGEWVDVPLTIQSHPNAVPGDYHVFIGMAKAANRPKAEQSVMQGGVPGVFLRISIEDKSVTLLRLRQFLVDRFQFNRDMLAASIILGNPGTDEIAPRGEMIIYKNNGEEITSLPINSDKKTVAVGDEQLFSVSLPNTLPIGKYKALLAVEYGDGNVAQIYDTTFFYVFPVVHMMLVFIVILLLILFLLFRVHRRNSILEDDELDGAVSLPVFIKSDRSVDQSHDINLAKKEE